jgi:hypothetical protein
MQTPEATQGSEVNFLAGAFQIVSPVSSAVVTQPVAPAVPEEAETIAPKSAFSISSLNPELAFRHIRRSAMESGGKAVDQLSSLSSAISSGLSNKDVALSNDGVDDKMLAAPAPSIAGNAVQTAGTVRRDNNVGEMLKSGSGYFQRFAYQKQEAPVLQGATNGTICHSGRAVSGDAFGSLGGNAPASSNAPASLPAAPDLVKKGLINGAPGLVGAPVDPRYGQSNEVGDIEAAAPPAKIVPEADTWLLLMVIALLLAATWFARRRAEKNGLDKA